MLKKMNTKKDIDFRISIDETIAIKGIAICFMLWVHLFNNSMYADYSLFFRQTALFGRIAISLFLFVSAYGLTVQYAKVFNKPIKETFKFQAKRYVKFYFSYWVIFLIFVPIGVLVFGRDLQTVYDSTNAIPVKSVIRDFFAIGGKTTYAPISWWFNTIIVGFYLLFPFLYFIAKKWTVFFLIISAILWNFDLGVLPINMHWYMFHFAVGIVFALHIDKVNRFLNRFNYWALLTSMLLLFCLLFYLQTFHYDQTPLDGIIALNMVLITVLLCRKLPSIGVLKFLGNHAMNIYLIHPFIFAYFFSEFIYSFKYPALIFLVLLAVCLTISIVIEYGKQIARFPVLIKNIINRIG